MQRGGVTIRQARERARLTQAALAARLGTSQAAVWRWESGRVEPPWSSVARAVSACGMALSTRILEVDEDEWRLVLAGRDRSPRERLAELARYSRFVTAGRRAVREVRRGRG